MLITHRVSLMTIYQRMMPQKLMYSMGNKTLQMKKNIMPQ